MTYPPFTLGGSIHNKEEFSGRYFHFLSVINPASLIKSEADIRAAEGLLLRSRNEARGGVVKGLFNPQIPNSSTGCSGYTNKEMWDAQTLVQSAVHPDTGEIIPKPFRMSGYVPFNLPVSSSHFLLFNSHPFRFSSDCWCLKELQPRRFGSGQIKRIMLLSTTQTETRRYDLLSLNI